MPGRVALGTSAWWEPWTAVALTLAAIAGLVAFAGRVYTGAILHRGTTIKLRDAWTRATKRSSSLLAAEPNTATAAQVLTSIERDPMSTLTPNADSSAIATLVVAVALGVTAAVVFSDVIVGIAAGAALFAVVTRAIKARTPR